jgi:hypothetical protein
MALRESSQARFNERLRGNDSKENGMFGVNCSHNSIATMMPGRKKDQCMIYRRELPGAGHPLIQSCSRSI